jgi:hypothetical protein
MLPGLSEKEVTGVCNTARREQRLLARVWAAPFGDSHSLQLGCELPQLRMSVRPHSRFGLDSVREETREHF